MTAAPIPQQQMPPPQPVPTAQSVPARSWVERIIRDPNAIWMREMRQSARLGRTPWILFAITLTISLLMCSIGGLASASHTAPASIGSALFQVFFSLAYLVVTLVGPAVAANSIASEREGKTWEAVLLTGLTPKNIARGKFMAAYTTIALYIVVLAPVGALSFLFGGVTAVDVVTAFAFLFLLAALTIAFGLAVSSLMTSLRAAIVVTLVLAILIGPVLYGIFGSLCSIGIHALWNEVPEGSPIWLPLAFSRAKFGWEYVTFLIALPLLLIAIPAWFLYEVTVSNLTGDADDRSTGLKRWFSLCTPLLAIVSAIPSLAAPDDDARRTLAIFGLMFFSTHLGFSAMLFAFEPPGPSRRVRIHWDRDRVGFFTRFFGPGLGKSSFLVTVMGFIGVFATAFAEIARIYVSGMSGRASEYMQQIFFFAMYTAGFFVFMTGLTAWLRSRGNAPWIARLIAAAVLFLISAGPWIVAAIGGVLAQKEGWIVAAPSPFYVFYMMSWIDGTHSSSDMPIVEAGVVCSFVWGLLGLVLLSVAARRCAVVVAQHDAAVAQAEAALREEALQAERARQAAANAPPEPPAPADPPAPAPEPTG
jgi:ABC-type transport system involved in multi-copper enzyme maturation permease subunit